MVSYVHLSTLALIIPYMSAAALPAPTTLPPCKTAEFTLQMLVDNNWQSLNALGCGGNGSVLNIVAEPMSEYLGTPAITNGTNTSALQLEFNLDGHNQQLTSGSGLWTLFVGDVGDVEGLALPVIAQQGIDYTGFMINNGSVWNQMTDADQDWYACNVSLQGAQYTTLSWGLMDANGTWPAGCAPTVLMQNFNLNCSDS